VQFRVNCRGLWINSLFLNGYTQNKLELNLRRKSTRCFLVKCRFCYIIKLFIFLASKIFLDKNPKNY